MKARAYSPSYCSHLDYEPDGVVAGNGFRQRPETPLLLTREAKRNADGDVDALATGWAYSVSRGRFNSKGHEFRSPPSSVRACWERGQTLASYSGRY